MDLLNIPYTILEIYPQDTNSSDPENINDDSHWIQISTLLLESNPSIVENDLETFVNSLDEIYVKFNSNIKTQLEEYYENNMEISKEYDECFNDTFVCDVTKINDFLNKYLKIKSHIEIITQLINIQTIQNYVKNYMDGIDYKTMVFAKFIFE
jgi:hypothetical protein